MDINDFVLKMARIFCASLIVVSCVLVIASAALIVGV